MGKNRSSWTQRTFDKFVSEGRGQGRGKSYKPWLTIHDFASQGRSTRTTGWKTNRVQHFMSDHEVRYFYLLEWSDVVTDIREQFPLIEHEVTQEIAKEMGVKHPTDPSSGFPIILTTDFLITVQYQGKPTEIARTIKPAKDLENTRTIEKLEIERRYWIAKGVDWGIVTENEVPRVLVKNIEVIHPAYRLEATPEIDVPNLRLLATSLKKKLRTTIGSISNIAAKSDEEMNLAPGTSLAVFKHLVARKEVLLDMNKRMDFTHSAKSIKGIVDDGSLKVLSA